MKIIDKLRISNNRRIERRRIKKPFLMTPQRFYFRGLDTQLTDNWERHTKQLPTGVGRILDMRLQALKYDVLSNGTVCS